MRNPFEIGDEVIANGFCSGVVNHNFDVKRAIADKALLRIRRFDPSDNTVLVTRKNRPSVDIWLHLTEIRVPAANELGPRFERGTVIRVDDNGKVAMVARNKPDSDGDIFVTYVDNGSGDHLRVVGRSTRPYTILGRLSDAGWEPA